LIWLFPKLIVTADRATVAQGEELGAIAGRAGGGVAGTVDAYRCGRL
jgi:hypothetical protein